MDEQEFYDNLMKGSDCLIGDWNDFTEGHDILGGDVLENIPDSILITHGLLRGLDYRHGRHRDIGINDGFEYGKC